MRRTKSDAKIRNFIGFALEGAYRTDFEQFWNKYLPFHQLSIWLTLPVETRSQIMKRTKTVLQFIIFLSLGVFLIWFSTRSFTENEINRVKQLVFNAKLGIVVPCILILLMSHYFRAIRWKMMIKPLGKHPSTLNVFFAVLTGFFFNLLFPRLGEVMKCSLLGKYEKIPVDRLIGTMVAERVIDLLCLIVVILLTISSQMGLVGEYARELSLQVISKIKASPGTIFYLMILIMGLTILVYWLYKKAGDTALGVKIKEMVKGVIEGLVSIKKVERPFLFVFYTLAIWFLYLSSIRVGFYALEDLVQLGWVPSLTVLTFGSFAMIATQGGIGAYQFAVQKTLALYGINEVSGLAFGWLLWSVQTVMLFLVGPASLLLLFIKNKPSKTISSN